MTELTNASRAVGENELDPNYRVFLAPHNCPNDNLEIVCHDFL